MKINTLTFASDNFPPMLRTIPNPPQKLYVLAHDLTSLLAAPRVSIVGSRKVSAYGRAVTTQLATELATRGVVTVSGLALGVDAIAHQATLDAGGRTIAVLPAGLSTIYPRSHVQLARSILERGGALISEYPEEITDAFKMNFIARNRLVSALGDGLLITEAAEKSGSLHTARFALEQGKEVLAVPGNITSLTSAGTNNLIKSGATPVTSVDDIIFTLSLKLAEDSTQKVPRGSNDDEQCILDLLASGTTDGHELLALSELEASKFNQTLTMLEITGKIKALGNNNWSF